MRTRRRFFREFNKTAPTYKTIMKWFNIFKNNGSLARENEISAIIIFYMIPLVYTSLLLDLPSHLSASQFNISRSKVHRILQALKLKSYKIQLHQKLYERDKEKHLYTSMCETLLDLIRNNPELLLIMSDEASFHVNGAVNRHNCRIWSEENPHEFYESVRKRLS
ncbi:unnamed protein product [Psylliodes chrysocephalus]|uniref:Transposase n=1 Tax=Psylliodes chrysocephalus TaxID=3402493 RepID=A0A9P0GIZ5_9CUCU|nr:unnamed protein product [Psylliodes chrysocephala]